MNASENAEALKVAVGPLLVEKAQSRAAFGPLQSGMDTVSSGDENTPSKRDKERGNQSINNDLDNAMAFIGILRGSDCALLCFQV